MNEPGFWLDHSGDSDVTGETRSPGRGEHPTWGIYEVSTEIQPLNPHLQGGTEPGKETWALLASDSGSQPWPPTGNIW